MTAGLTPISFPAYETLRPVTDLSGVILCDNPSEMTFEGTNTVVLRAPGSPTCVVVDPGPDDRAHAERIAAIVSGIADACARAGVALVGGETAEHPGLLGPSEYDVAGAATGVVEHEHVIGPHLVAPGDVVLGLASSGLHSNGYSLVRRVVDAAGWALEDELDDLPGTLGEALLTPTRIYARPLLTLIERLRGDGPAAAGVHALSHVTGGGLAANLARVLPTGTLATVDRATWTPPRIFTLVGEAGGVPREDLERTLNMGVGFVAVLPADHADTAREVLGAEGIDAWVLGEVTAGEATGGDVVQGAKGVDGGAVQVVGEHP